MNLEYRYDGSRIQMGRFMSPDYNDSGDDPDPVAGWPRFDFLTNAGAPCLAFETWATMVA
jgi:hypothetical protein